MSTLGLVTGDELEEKELVRVIVGFAQPVAALGWEGSVEIQDHAEELAAFIMENWP